MKRLSLRTSGIAAVVGITLAASLLGASTVVSAQSISLSELTAILTSLGISSDKISAAESAIAPAPTTVAYTRNLTTGSTGADVTALQNTLIANGDLAAGLNTGFFGALTQAAVSKWQASAGLPATGFFGPLSMAKLNATAMTTTTTTTTSTTSTTPSTSSVAGCATGAMFSSTTGASCGTTAATVTNTGVEGILTANLNPTPSSGADVYVSDTGDSLLGIKLQAQLSPITIQRVRVDLGNSTSFYTKYFTNLYLVSDTGQTLAQATLNSNTVTKQTSGSQNTYYLTFSGFNYVVPGDNSVHVLTVKGDVYGSIDSDLNGTVVPIGIDSNDIRGVDGAGVDQYAPSGNITNAISNSVTINQALSDSATLQLSTDPSSPLAAPVVANTGSNSNEADGVTVLIFDAYAQKDSIQIDNLQGTTTLTTGVEGIDAAPTTAYLYDGSTQIGSSAITWLTTSVGQFNFTNINHIINANTTDVLTIKEDIKNADSTATGQITNVTANGVLAENSVGDTLLNTGAAGTLLTGSATGQSLSVLKAGPVFSLSSINVVHNAVTSDQSGNATGSETVTFNLGIQAVGSDLTFGTAASSTHPLIGLANLDVFNQSGSVLLGVANSDAVEAIVSNVASKYATVGYTAPSGQVTAATGGAAGFVLGQNQTISIPVTVTLYANSGHSDGYAIGINGINWGLGDNVAATLSSTFMAGQTSWRGASQQLP